MASVTREEVINECSALLPNDPQAIVKTAKPVYGTTTVVTEVNSDSDQESLPCKDHSPTRKKEYENVRLLYVLPSLAIGTFLAAADQTLIVSTYGVIGSELNALNNTSWVATAYFLTLTSFQPILGKLSDVFGRKNTLLASYIIFAIGALGCGLAATIQQLIVARGLAGIGGGGMTIVTSVLLSDIIPLRERGAYQGYMNIVYAAGAGLGAPLGGFFADKLSWRWLFYLQLPFCAIAIVVVSLFVRLPTLPSQRVPLREKLARIDYLGALILVSVVFSLLMGLDHGSNHTWTSPLTIGPLLAVLPLLVTLVLVERYFAREPFAPKRIIADAGLLPQYLVNFAMYGAHFAVIFYIPLYYQIWMGASATQAGMLLLPPVIGGFSGSIFSGRVMRTTGRYWKLTLVTQAIYPFALAAMVLSLGPGGGSKALLIPALVIMGFCSGLSVTTTLIALIANTTQVDQAVVTATSYLFRALGSAAGVSGASVIVQLILRTELGRRLREEDVPVKDIEKIVQGVRQSLEILDSLDKPLRHIVEASYRDAIIWALMLPVMLGSLAFVFTFWMRDKKLDR